MAKSLMNDLTKAGFKALRLSPGAPPPGNGWLVRGVFMQVQEGNRLQRAVIGLGRGATDLQVVAVLSNLSQGPPKPLYEIGTDISSGNKVGAAPTLALGPWGAAARFALAGGDLEKNVKQTATQISAQVVRHITETKYNPVTGAYETP
jgi:hypothetical protein